MSGTTICPMCHGTGKCPECKGAGRLPCVSCDGLGCRDCGGTGRVVCVPCDGVGECWRCEGKGMLAGHSAFA